MEPQRLEVTIARLRMRTPLMTASGTSGSTNDAERLNKSKAVVQSLGAFVTKGVTIRPRQGNPELRVVEISTGILNSIGLQNKGAKRFLMEELPKLLKYELPIIVNISASNVDQFGKLAGYLIEKDVNRKISGIEINVSCPNIKEGGVAFGTDPKYVQKIVKAVRGAVTDDILVITKLTPNVTDITVPAKAAIAGGTDAISMINTLRGVAIDIQTGKPYLGNVYGGVSGPPIKPVGVFMVYECFKKIPECHRRDIPIIGIGGICIWQDALEYIMAGATAVGVGTAWFVYPRDVFPEIKAGLEKYLMTRKTTIMDKIGTAHG